VQRTLGIIKPDAVAQNLVGKIVAHIEAAGLSVEALRMVQLTEDQARGFYQVHQHRPFFQSLLAFMTSGPCVVMVLKGEDAIERYRALMGATDPAKAAPNTLRALHATDVEKNAVHGSDGPDTAAQEIAFFRAALSRWA
jgi:nucleoside-diphosphate kinase